MIKYVKQEFKLILKSLLYPFIFNEKGCEIEQMLYCKIPLFLFRFKFLIEDCSNINNFLSREYIP
jgi:hypothetical protein